MKHVTMVNLNKLKKELAKTYRAYLQDKKSAQVRSKALELYNKYSGLSVILDKSTSAALNSLIDIVDDTGRIVEDKQVLDFLRHLEQRRIAKTSSNERV